MATKVGLCFLRRLLPTTVKVQLVAELHLAEKIRVRRGGSARRGVVADDREGLARRGGLSCCGGCYRRPRGSGSSRSFSLPRRFVFAVEVRLAPKVVADDREGPA